MFHAGHQWNETYLTQQGSLVRAQYHPPITVINRCMRLVHTAESEATPTAEQLAERVRVTLADPDLAQVRSALSRLVDAFASEHAQPRSAGAALK